MPDNRAKYSGGAIRLSGSPVGSSPRRVGGRLRAVGGSGRPPISAGLPQGEETCPGALLSRPSPIRSMTSSGVRAARGVRHVGTAAAHARGQLDLRHAESAIRVLKPALPNSAAAGKALLERAARLGRPAVPAPLGFQLRPAFRRILRY